MSLKENGTLLRIVCSHRMWATGLDYFGVLQENAQRLEF
jgi:hypothetical protein